jgi:hypothetical protein
MNAPVANGTAVHAADIYEVATPEAVESVVTPIVAFDDETCAPEVIVPPPCYFWNVCTQRAATEKAGRAVCSACANNLNGFEYPLRSPSRSPLYKSGRDVAEAMNIID